MAHLLKLKCARSPLNLRILPSTSVPFYTHDGASAKFSTNSHETDYSAGSPQETGRRLKGNLGIISLRQFKLMMSEHARAGEPSAE